MEYYNGSYVHKVRVLTSECPLADCVNTVMKFQVKPVTFTIT